MPVTEKTDECKCGLLRNLAEDPKNNLEFHPLLNEYHVKRKDAGGYSVMYFCPFCGGRLPKSQRGRLFHKLTDAERLRLTELTKTLRTVQEVVAAFGEPDMKNARVSVSTPGGEDKPETTQTYPVMTYTKLSDTVNVNVQVYPNDQVVITFQGKPMLIQQTAEFHPAPLPKPPEPENQVDTRKRYDVYCIEPNRQNVIYRNSLFKATAALLPNAGGRMYPDFVELEQANGQCIFIPRSSIFRFCEPGTAVVGEALPPDKPAAH